MPRALLINIGNSFTEIVRDDGKSTFKERERIATAALAKDGWRSKLLNSHEELPIVVACVVPSIRKRLEKQLQDRRIVFINADLELGLDFSLVDGATVGADRIANALAACDLLQLPAIIVDAGTAITIEVVDAEGRFAGGMIMPGRRLMRNALAVGTGQLPEVPLMGELPEPIGTTTATAIHTGIDRGLVGALERHLADINQRIGGDGLPACTVGGDAEFFIRYLDDAVHGPADFTMHGLSLAADTLFG